MLVRPSGSNVAPKPLLGGTELCKVPARLVQRDDVRPTPVVGVIELDRIVLPEADGADVVSPGRLFLEGEKAAAGTGPARRGHRRRVVRGLGECSRMSPEQS